MSHSCLGSNLYLFLNAVDTPERNSSESLQTNVQKSTFPKGFQVKLLFGCFCVCQRLLSLYDNLIWHNFVISLNRFSDALVLYGLLAISCQLLIYMTLISVLLMFSFYIVWRPNPILNSCLWKSLARESDFSRWCKETFYMTIDFRKKKIMGEI